MLLVELIPSLLCSTNTQASKVRQQFNQEQVTQENLKKFLFPHIFAIQTIKQTMEDLVHGDSEYAR